MPNPETPQADAADAIKNLEAAALEGASQSISFLMAENARLSAELQAAKEALKSVAHESVTLDDAERFAHSALIRLSATIPARGEWQPIETAPKDGTRFTVARVGGPVWSDVCWRKMQRVPDRWESFIGTVPFEPTHWMPKPNPPLSASPSPDTENGT